MFDPYKMSLVNATLSVLLIIIVFIYKHVYPKKKVNLLAFLIIISLLPIVSLLRIGDYESGDFNIHIYRTISFYQNLTDGNLMPSWAGMLNGTYGYPLFIFLNPLPYYLISFFHFLGFSFITSLKFFLGFAFVLSGIFMYFFTKEALKNELAAFTASIFYLFFPYHLIDLHFRIDVGEVLCFTLVPLLLLFTYRLFKQNSLLYVLWTGLTFALLIMSHQAIAVLSLALVIPLLISQLLLSPAKIRQIKLWLQIGTSFVLGLFISSYVWLPYITYSKYNLSSALFKSLPSFINFNELLYAPWRFGLLFQGPKGELSFLIGYTQLLVLGIMLFYLLAKRAKAKHAKEITVWLITTFFLIFMLTGFSQVIWLNVPIIKNMLMSSRVLLILTFSISFVAGYFALINKKRKILIWLLIFLTIGYTILNWGQRRVIPQISDAGLINNLPYSTYQGEGLTFIGNTPWFSSKPVWISKVPVNKIDTIQGQANIKTLSISSTKHYYSANSTSDATLKENTLYFPGWDVTVNGKETKINFKDKKYSGLIVFKIPKGNDQIAITYKDLLILQILKLVFVLSLIIILFYTLFTTKQLLRLIYKLRKIKK